MPLWLTGRSTMPVRLLVLVRREPPLVRKRHAAPPAPGLQCGAFAIRYNSLSNEDPEMRQVCRRRRRRRREQPFMFPFSLWLTVCSFTPQPFRRDDRCHAPGQQTGKNLGSPEVLENIKTNTVAKFQSSEIYDKTSINPVKKNTACPLAGGSWWLYWECWFDDNDNYHYCYPCCAFALLWGHWMHDRLQGLICSYYY